LTKKQGMGKNPGYDKKLVIIGSLFVVSILLLIGEMIIGA